MLNELTFNCPQPTMMVCLLDAHRERSQELRYEIPPSTIPAIPKAAKASPAKIGLQRYRKTFIRRQCANGRERGAAPTRRFFPKLLWELRSLLGVGF